MGGGPELPQRGQQSRELLICVQPLPEDQASKTLSEIREEFPDLEIKWYAQNLHNHAARENADVPEGNSSAFCATTPYHLLHLIQLSFLLLFTQFRKSSLVHPRKQTLQSYFIFLLSPFPDLQKRAAYLSTLFWLPIQPSAAPNLKFIQFSSAGVNHVANHPFYTDSKVPLCSANGVHGPQIAEWVIMMDLVHNHKYIDLYEQQRKKEWQQKTGMNVQDRVGKRVGILGYGSIGRQGKWINSSMHVSRMSFIHLFRNTAPWSLPTLRSAKELEAGRSESGVEGFWRCCTQRPSRLETSTSQEAFATRTPSQKKKANFLPRHHAARNAKRRNRPGSASASSAQHKEHRFGKSFAPCAHAHLPIPSQVPYLDPTSLAIVFPTKHMSPPRG